MTADPPKTETAVVEDPDTIVVYENRDQGGAAPPSISDTNIVSTDTSYPHGGGAAYPTSPPPPPSQPTTTLFEATPATDPAELVDQDRLKRGDASPQEALLWFQQHGSPDLNTLPTFVNGAWLFPIGAPGSQPHLASVTTDDGTIVYRVVPTPPIEESQPPAPTPAPAPGASPPPPPVPGSIEAARQQGFSIGQVYGEFRAWSESFSSLLQDPHGGVSTWDRMSSQERTTAINQVQAKYASLPKLPAAVDQAHAEAMQEGFKRGATVSYDGARWENRIVWVAAELAKNWAITSAATPTPVAIGSAFSDNFSDCAAQTASVVLENAGHPDIPASFLRRNFGLPRVAISNYDDAVSYAKNWFTEIGLELSPTGGGLAPIAEGGTAGSYVVFFKGGATGGHVAYGSVTASGVNIIDNRLGKTWTSVTAAQNGLGMRATGAYRVIGVKVP